MSPAIDPIFEPTVSSGHWSSTVYEFNPAFAWLEVFVDGSMVANGKIFNSFVRAVRGGSPSEP